MAEQRCAGAAVYMAETGEIGELRQELEKKASCCQVRAVCQPLLMTCCWGAGRGGVGVGIATGNMDQSSTHRRTCCLRCYI